MTPPRSTYRVFIASVLLTFAQGCLLQRDQTLPFELAEGEGAAKTIGAEGGVISVPPDFSLALPAGALSSSASVTVAPRISAPFPTDAGSVVPGTAYDIGPAGLTLAKPARVEIRVPEALLAAGEDVRLSVALLEPDGTVVTSTGSYDVTSGLLSAPIDRLGSVSAVIEADVIDVEAGSPPGLGGGSFSGSPSRGGGGAGVSVEAHRFQSSCSPDEPGARRCSSSALVRVWISQELRDRIGESLVISSLTFSGDLSFVSFDEAGQPTSAIGQIDVVGDLKAMIGQTVASVEVDEHRVTGTSAAPTVTGVKVIDNRMLFANTSEGNNTSIEFGLTPIATGELLTLRLEKEVELENFDGTTSIGSVFLHVRLRR